MKIGFIGLGIMGSRMAANLLANDVDLIVYNRTVAKTKPLAERGAQVARTMADFADVDILFTMLAHPEAITAVSQTENGFLNHLRPNTLWVDCSTVTPSFSRQMAAATEAKNIHFLDAPVAGTKPHAANKELTFIVGGFAEDVEKATPYFNMMGQRIAHVGGHMVWVVRSKSLLTHYLPVQWPPLPR